MNVLLRTIAIALSFSCAGIGAEPVSLDFESEPPGVQFVGEASIDTSGPSDAQFEGMPEVNHALSLDGNGDYLRIESRPELQFRSGDEITMECWLKADRISRGSNVYLMGKGRTHLADDHDNQNYALRLRERGGGAHLSFLFRSRGDDNQPAQYHRWTSNTAVGLGGTWQHVAVSYRFGDPNSLAAYINGCSVGGRWDMGGATVRAPVVDDDELWIGSSMGGKASSSFAGAVDRVMIHRRLLTAEELSSRRITRLKPPTVPTEHWNPRSVNITVFEGLTTRHDWPLESSSVPIRYQQRQFLFGCLPQPYLPGGVRRDYRGTVLLRAMAQVEIPTVASRLSEEGHSEPQTCQWMVRAAGLSRLWIDDKVVAQTPPLPNATDAHRRVAHYQTDDPWLRRPHPGHREVIVTRPAEPGSHLVTLETLIGDDGLRHDPGETTVAMRISDDQPWQILGPSGFADLTDHACEALLSAQRQRIVRFNDGLRRSAAKADDEMWDRRHESARRHVARLPKLDVPNPRKDQSPIDAFLDARRGGPSPQIDRRLSDDAFARRLYLQTLGVTPTQSELATYRSHGVTFAQRRTWLIDHVLEDDRWADHWTAYWMDVLAENPNILKPTLNNTGPFRWFLYESMRDNTAMDRWVTDLIRMEGSVYGGGPAGFKMASQNDVPMAAKAHVIGTAFLAVNMKCARCHDAPYHDWSQGDLFSLAAMLGNEAIELPPSSSVPAAFFEDEDAGDALITVSLSPGDSVPPEWTLGDYAGDPTIDESLLGRDDTPRERLAYLVTGPPNAVFPKVIVNRIWKQLIGEAIVEPVDDWELVSQSHPDLLEYLARDFVASGYDMKALVRRMVTSDLYAIAAEDRPIARNADRRTFDSPRQQRLSAEQIVDSMHVAVGRSMNSDRLTFDPENTRKANAFGDLGAPWRAWQLTSLSNERDRPSLAMPRAAAICECLEAFGWTGSRQEPINGREHEPNVVQPGVLANGKLSIQLTRLTDDAEVTELCIGATSCDALVDALFDRFLSRRPTDREREVFTGLLGEDFDHRIVTDQAFAETPVREAPVHWSNHLSIEANEIRLREEQRLLEGPPPTRRLDRVWREKAEDAIWALINTPEYQFIP